jgi:hypothetical protein
MKHPPETRIPRASIETRRNRVLDFVARPVERVGTAGLPLPPGQLEHLLREAEELYWNELAWEELTDEEQVSDGHLTELVFPGFLAFVDGLLLDSSPEGAYEAPKPHPDAVERILIFLAERLANATNQLEHGADSENLVWARAMTAHLIDLVLYRLYGLTPAEREQLEARD